MAATKQSDVETGRMRGRPKLADVAAIERNLLAVALKLFIKHGYGATSMASIARAAQISKTTLYSRFSSKQALFRAIMAAQIDRLTDSTGLSRQSDPPGLEDGLKDFANRMLSASLRGDILQINRLIFSESHRFPELGAAAAERMQVGIRQVSGFIRERAERDHIPCSNAVRIAEAYIHMLRGWLINVMLTNEKVSTVEREQWVDTAVYALLASRGDW